MTGIRSIMDRTEASDAFDAGSIPVGCILDDFMRKKNSRDHISVKEIAHQLGLVFKDYLLLFKEWITDYGKVFLPVLLLILVCITVTLSLNARSRVEAAAREALEILEESKSEVLEVQEILFEVDAYPDINRLIHRYYDALEMADIDILIDLQSNVTQTEVIRLQKMSEYIDTYDNIHVYTKPGPYIDTYIAYVSSEVLLKGRTEYTPGLQAFYICRDEFGNYYINNSELTEEEETYIKNIAKQSDVLDKKNSVNVEYVNLMENNPELSEYWAKLSVEIDLAVSEELALEAKLKDQLANGSDGTDEEEEELPLEPVIRKVTVSEKVNVRKSASATADKLGQAKPGDTFVLYEQMVNGWSRVDYQGKEGFIKTEYIEIVEDIDKIPSSGTVTIGKEAVNVRSDADKNSKKLGSLVPGQIVELIEYVNDGEWCKIKFNGQIGYISSQYIKK